MDVHPIWQACTGVLGATAGRNPTWAGPLVVEKPWENCSEGGISLRGVPDAGEWLPLMSDSQCKGPWPMQVMWGPGFQKHIPRCCLLALPSSSWDVGLGMGRALPQTKGWFDTKPMKLHVWAPHWSGMCRGTRGHCRTKHNMGRPSGGGETLGTLV